MQASLPAWADDLGHGVYAIDTAFQRDHFDAAYLVVEDGRAAFIDTGPGPALPRLLGLLDALGLSRDAVDAVIPTHVHLDHAGGAGALMAELPRAQMWVHPRGLRHMVDPTQLYAGALAVYGQAEMDRSYGQLLPVPAERVRATSDGMTLHLGTRALRFMDTPGHALHHHCIWDERTRGWFTGDSFGLSYREFDTDHGAWIAPTSTPVQFDPVALRQTVLRLLQTQPECMYLTHYSRVHDVPRLGALFLQLLDDTVALARALASAPDRHAALTQGLSDLYQRSLADHGCRLPAARISELLAVDIELNAQGIGIWLDRASRRSAA